MCLPSHRVFTLFTWHGFDDVFTTMTWHRRECDAAMLMPYFATDFESWSQPIGGCVIALVAHLALTQLEISWKIANRQIVKLKVINFIVSWKIRIGTRWVCLLLESCHRFISGDFVWASGVFGIRLQLLRIELMSFVLAFICSGNFIPERYPFRMRFAKAQKPKSHRPLPFHSNHVRISATNVKRSTNERNLT